MEVLVTIAYFFLVRLIFFDYKLLKFNFFWKMVVFGLYFAAVLTEITLLGQFTPYTKEMVVNNFVVQIAPEIGGEVTKIHVRPNTPIKQGAPIISFDPRREQNKVAELEAALAAAKQNVKVLAAALDSAKAQVSVEEENIAEAKAALDAAAAAVKTAQAEAVYAQQKYDIERKDFQQGAGSKLRTENAKQALDTATASLEQARAEEARAKVAATSTAALDRAKAERRQAQAAYDSQIGGVNTQVAQIEAQLASARIALDNRTINAPSNGYIVNLQVQEGQVVRLKERVLSFVSTDELRLVGNFRQKGIQNVAPGDKAEIAVEMYPGKVFPAEVVSVIWATPGAQGQIGGTLRASVPEFSVAESFWVRLKIIGDHPHHPLRFGATGSAAIYTSESGDALQFLRRLEIQSESYLDYLYNPF